MRYYAHPEEELDLVRVNEAVEEVFAALGRNEVEMPPKVYVTIDGGDFRTMPASIPSLGLAGVKVVNVHPENPARGLPSVMALLVLLEPATGLPYAMMNATTLTDRRTGAAGAVAARHLCRRTDGVEMGLVGAGRQAEAQLEATRAWIGLDRVRVWSRSEASAAAFVSRFPDLEVEIAALERVADCDLLVTTTPSRTPLVQDEWVREGTHINAIGADAPGKQELDPAILVRARLFVDDPRQAVHSGEINVPIASGQYDPGQIAGTLGDVVLGRAGRRSATEVTVFDSTGLAIQDLAIARVALGGPDQGIELPFP